VGSALFVLPASGATKRRRRAPRADPSGTVNVGLSWPEPRAAAQPRTRAPRLTPAAQAIVDNYGGRHRGIERRGGLGGRQVKPVIYNFPAQSQDFNQTTSTECAALTQDAKVIAFTALQTCAVRLLRKAKTPPFQFGGATHPRAPTTRSTPATSTALTASPRAGVAPVRPIWDKAGLFPKGANGIVFDDGRARASSSPTRSTHPLQEASV
jgi:hypothetical protein